MRGAGWLSEIGVQVGDRQHYGMVGYIYIYVTQSTGARSLAYTYDIVVAIYYLLAGKEKKKIQQGLLLVLPYTLDK